MAKDIAVRKWATATNKSANDKDRVTNALVTDTAVEGTFLVDGSGEALKTVSFPVKFIQRPNFTTGGELHIDTVPVAGQFPTISCVINRWTQERVDGFSKMYFVGAELVVVTTGPTNQRMWVHWRASGKAIVNPANVSSSSITTTSTV